MSTISLFKDIENKHDIYRCEDCMEKFCGTLREHAMKIINFRTETMKILTTEQQESYKMQKYAIFLYKNLKINMQKIRNIVKLMIIVNIQVNIGVLHILYVI